MHLQPFCGNSSSRGRYHLENLYGLQEAAAVLQMRWFLITVSLNSSAVVMIILF